MATMVPPQKGVEYIFYVGLVSQADTKLLQNNPTLAAGDVLVSTDGGATSNLDTLPAVTPASSDMVKVTVSATEMNGDNIIVVFSDAAGSEWCDLLINIQTAAQSVDTMDTNIDTLVTRLTATRATYLDYLFSIYFGLVSAVAQAQAGAASSITLAAAASAVTDFYKGQSVVVYTGTGAGQARAISAYNGSTKVATITPAWATAPDATSWYVIINVGSAIIEDWEDGGRLDLLLDNIETDTNELQGLIASSKIAAQVKGIDDIDLSATMKTSVNTEVDTALTDYDPPTKTEMDTAHALLATPAQVNAQVLDVLQTDTFAEPASVPAATSSLKDKICWLFALARNKITQTATTQALRNDADGGNIATSTVSDDGTTATRGEWS